MMEIQFIQPEWLWLLPLVLISPWLIKRGYLTIAQQPSPATPVKHPLAGAVNSVVSRQQGSSRMLALIIGCLILITLAQPVKQGARLSAPPAPVDLMLIIDTSISMVLEDYQLDGKPVDRLTMMKALLDRFSRHYSGKRIGLVVLGDKPNMLLPPSEDFELVRYLIHRLRPAIAGRQAALGDAIAVAAEHLSRSDQDAPTTTMVLISDGVLPSGNLSPLEGARRAKQSGAKLHTIAMGATGKRDTEAAALLYEPADLELLQQIAQITGGRSFHAIDASAIDQALEAIEQHQQASVKPMPAPQLQQPLYIWPLSLAILLLVINSLLPYLTWAGKQA